MGRFNENVQYDSTSTVGELRHGPECVRPLLFRSRAALKSLKKQDISNVRF